MLGSEAKGHMANGLAAHVVMAGDYNKGSYMKGRLFNEAVAREGLPLVPFDLDVGTCPINGAASWHLGTPAARLETSAWTQKHEEHEMLTVSMPGDGKLMNQLICVPDLASDRMVFRPPPRKEAEETEKV